MTRALRWGGGVGALVVLLWLAGLLEVPDLRALNVMFDLRGPRTPTAPILIVSIDEDSFDELDLAWPWPRALHGRFLDIVRRGKPAAIGFDVIFAEPSIRGPADDQAFAAAVARTGNVVLAGALTVVKNELVSKVDFNLPLPELREHAAGFGPVNYEIDADGNVRRSELAYGFQGERLHSFVWHVFQVAVRAGVPASPLPADHAFLINYLGGPGTFRHIPYYRILNGEVGPEEFARKIVLVGATSPVLHDVFSTPFAPSSRMPGVEIHAHALETLLRGIQLRRVPRAFGMILALGLAFLSAGLTVRLRPFRALFAVGGLWLLVCGVALALFSVWHIWLETVGASLALALAYVTTVVVELLREQAEKRRLSRFFSPAVLREILRHRDRGLGSARRLLTVLFSDIRGFTSISERLPPEQVVEILGEYLTELTEVVFRHGGTVDKYVGDCIMALYNVPLEQPDHAAQAVRTALAFQASTRALSARWEARLGVRIRNGVGINTGEAIVGAMGSRQRLEYTAIGDTVNVAARLESVTKEYGVPIIISESTYRLVKDQFPTRPLGEVTVKGRASPVRIYAVLAGDPDLQRGAEPLPAAAPGDGSPARVRGGAGTVSGAEQAE